MEVLFKKYYQHLTNIAFYVTKNKPVAEDLAQELFVAIWEKRNQMGDIKNLKGYLSIAIKNRSLDFIKSQQLQESHFGEYLKMSETLTRGSGEDLESLRNHLDKGLSQLPPRCQLIFSLNRFEGLTNDEIASYLEISKRTVETQVSKALRILRVELKDAFDAYLSLFIF